MNQRSRQLVLFLAVTGLLAALTPACKPKISEAEALLQQSIDYHDPEGAWSSKPIELTVMVRLSERLAADRGYESRTDRINFDNGNDTFRYQSVKGDARIEIIGEGDELLALLNGSSEISDEDRATHSLAANGLPRWRDYFSYMFGMPMKLRDPGTYLDPTVKRMTFEDRGVLALRVTYDEEVGSDVWDFFMDPDTKALVGCRFFHDESIPDGEFLLFDGEVEGPHGLLLPRNRYWRMNVDGEYIALDEILSID